MIQFSFLLKPKAGQAGLLAIAVSIIIALVLAGGSLSFMSQQSANRNLVDQRSLQAYYVAQAGLQEALATRMLPRSNYLSFYTPAGTPKPVTPYYNDSGLVFQSPANKTRLLGVYRYVILGGDPSRQADGSYYGIPPGPPFNAANPNVTNNATPTPRLVTFNSNPPSSPFYVVSTGVTCVKNTGTNGADQGIDKFQTSTPGITTAKQLVLNPSGAPQCQTGYKTQEVTMVAQVSIEQENGAKDKVDSIRLFNDRNRINLSGGSFVPGRGWLNAGTWFDFDTAWGYQGNTPGLTPGRPMRIVFFKFGTNQIYHVLDVSGGGSVNAPWPIPADASMMVDFDGPIDYRSFSNVRWDGFAGEFYNTDLSGCKSGNSYSCLVRLYLNNPPWFTLYTGLKVVPILPYSTKALLLAPLGANIVPGGTSYHMDYGGQVAGATFRSFSYAPGTSVVVNFKTQ